jgi:hypothetical protein
MVEALWDCSKYSICLRAGIQVCRRVLWDTKVSWPHLFLILFVCGCATPEQQQANLAHQNNMRPYALSEEEQSLCRQGLVSALPESTKLIYMNLQPFSGFVGNTPVPTDSAARYLVNSASKGEQMTSTFICAIKYEGGTARFAAEMSLIGQPGSLKPLQVPNVILDPASTLPQTAAKPTATTNLLEVRAEPFRERLISPNSHKECLATIKQNLLDPTSFQLTSDFEPDPLWLMFPDRAEPNEIQFSAKMLARNRGGNIAPYRAYCLYVTDGLQLALKAGFSG